MTFRAQREPPSEDDQRGLPPSTIPAQILRNGGVQQNRSIQREVFDKLLAEFLYDPYVDLLDENLSDNARFVTHLIEAAMESRAQKDPFTPKTLDTHATDCLRAVVLTIERQPKVLSASVSVDTSIQGNQPPFVCWLLVKIFTIGAKESLNDVWTQLRDVLSTCVSSALEKPACWRMGKLVSDLLKATIDGEST